MQELRSATDLALREGDVHTCGPRAPSMAKPCWSGEVDKVRFLNALVSQAGLFGDTVEDCAQQFSAVRKKTEVGSRFFIIRHIHNHTEYNQ